MSIARATRGTHHVSEIAALEAKLEAFMNSFRSERRGCNVNKIIVFHGQDLVAQQGEGMTPK